MARAPNLNTGSQLSPWNETPAGLPAMQAAPRSGRPPPSTSAERGLPRGRASSLVATISTHSRRGSNASRSPRASRRHPHPYAPPDSACISTRHDITDTVSVAAPGQLVSLSPAPPDLDRYPRPVHSRADGPHNPDLLLPDRVGDLAEGPAEISTPRVRPLGAVAVVATAYMRYANDMHSIVMARSPHLSPDMCNQQTALFWAGLDDDAKLQWHQPRPNMRSRL